MRDKQPFDNFSEHQHVSIDTNDDHIIAPSLTPYSMTLGNLKLLHPRHRPEEWHISPACSLHVQDNPLYEPSYSQASTTLHHLSLTFLPLLHPNTNLVLLTNTSTALQNFLPPRITIHLPPPATPSPQHHRHNWPNPPCALQTPLLPSLHLILPILPPLPLRLDSCNLPRRPCAPFPPLTWARITVLQRQTSKTSHTSEHVQTTQLSLRTTPLKERFR